MSAFGYGASYMPSWRGNIQATTNAQNPTFNVAPEMARPNFNPAATSPWADPTLNDVGDWKRSAGGYDLGNLSHGGTTEGYYGDFVNRDAWRNPLEQLYGVINPGMQNPNELGKQNSLGANGINGMSYTPIYGYPTLGGGPGSGNDGLKNVNNLGPIEVGRKYNVNPGDMMGDKHGGAQQMYAAPTDAKQLYSSIGGLSLDQLMRMSGGGTTLADKFNNVAKDYSNAYANPNYGKRLYGQQDNFGGNSLTQAETSDWLQQSYQSTLKRMNDNFLL